MTPRNGTAPMISYLRQSRAKEKTISIEEQRRIIREWAKANDVKLAGEIVEQNVSGSKSWRERELGQAIASCEAGSSQGVIVAFQDRLSREHGLATAEVWAALEEAQARLVCAGEGLDTATGDHEMLFQIKAAIAREQWKRHRRNWDSARRNAVERKIHVGPTPAGYRRNGERRLHPNEHGPRVTAAFEARAKGATIAQITEILDGVPTKNGKTTWSFNAAKKLLANRVYLGEARSGEYVTEDAHEALVGPGVFSKVQALAAATPRRGEYAKREKHHLTGLVRCGSCGGSMVRTYTRRNGLDYSFWRCTARCEAPASIGAKILEPYVDSIIHEATVGTGSVFTLRAPQLDTKELESELLEAEAELKLYVETTSIATLGQDLFTAGLTPRQERVRKAQEALVAATPTTEADYDIPPELADELRKIPGGLEVSGESLTELLTTHLPVSQRRAFYQRLFQRIVVNRGKGGPEKRVDVYVGGKKIPPRTVGEE